MDIIEIDEANTKKRNLIYIFQELHRRNLITAEELSSCCKKVMEGNYS